MSTAGTASDARFVHFKDELHRVVVDVVDLSRIDRWSRDRLRDEVHELARRLAPDVDRRLPKDEVERAADEVVDEVFGLGPLEPLLRDPTVTEILVNGPAQACVACRINTLISGGTGAGKTTLLNVLSSFIPRAERLVTIEDAAELRLRQPHVVRMETRTANMEGHGAVSQRDLVRNALRMRPD